MSEYPIQRLIVYNVVPGTTTITLDMHPDMHDTGTYHYQLQVNRLPNNDSGEWTNVGLAADNVTQLTDAITESHGFKLDKYYRVILTTDQGQYVSPIEGCFGQLHRYEWKLIQEIIRKEKLRHNNVSIPCVLLKVKTSGEKCPYCTSGSSGSSNSECTYCYGTGYLGGYYAPFKCQMVEITPSQLMEKHESDNVTTLNMSMNRYTGRFLGIPEIKTDDIIVDLSTSQRFRVTGSQVISQLRRVPIAQSLDMNLLPYSDAVYNIPIDETNYDNSKTIPDYGCGYKLVDHDYPSEDNLTYKTEDGMPIAGGTISIYSVDGTTESLVFTTSTDGQGKWTSGYMAPIGSYKVKASKDGFYTTTTVDITVATSDLKGEEKEHYNNDHSIEINNKYVQKFF